MEFIDDIEHSKEYYFEPKGKYDFFENIKLRIDIAFFESVVKRKKYFGRTLPLKSNRTKLTLDKCVFHNYVFFFNLLLGDECIDELEYIVSACNNFLKDVYKTNKNLKVDLRDHLTHIAFRTATASYIEGIYPNMDLKEAYGHLNEVIEIFNAEIWNYGFSLSDDYKCPDVKRKLLPFLAPCITSLINLRNGLSHQILQVARLNSTLTLPVVPHIINEFKDIICSYYKTGEKKDSLQILINTYLLNHSNSFSNFSSQDREKNKRGLNLTIAAFTFKAIENKWIDDKYTSQEFIRVYYNSFNVKIRDPKVFHRKNYYKNKAFEKYIEYFENMPKNF